MVSARSRSLVGLAILGVLLAACAGDDGPVSGSESGGEARLRVVVDTDMGFDDVRALMLLAERPEVELVAVTVSGVGLARCPTGATNARALLDALDRPDVAVACGQRAPLEGANLAPTAWRDAADDLAGMDLPAPGPLDDVTAVDVLIDSIGSSSEPVVVLTLGPLTNLAQAFDVEPSLVERVDRVVAMGGAFDVGGNTLSFVTPPVAEFNVWFDPVAAAQVLSSGVDVTLIPLDATNDVPVTPRFYEAFGVADDRDGGGPAAALIGGYNAENPLIGGLYHWDDLAAATLVDPGVVELEARRVSVVTEPTQANGQTVDDRSGTAVQIAVAADRDAFEDLFYESFGISAPPISAFTPDARVVFDGDECHYEGPDPLPPELTIEVSNTSDQSVLGIIVGVYDPGTTAEDLAAYEASNPSGPPSFITLAGIAPLPSATTSYWVFTNPPEATLSCAYDIGSGVELAGPRLT